MTSETMTAGMANITMNDWTSMDQTKRGTRSSDIPAARCLNMVAMISIATQSADDLGERDHLRPEVHSFAGGELGTGERRVRERPASAPMFRKKPV